MLDAKAGYWSVHLNEESQFLTTFRPPFGRFCWRRLPFRLNGSQYIFQFRINQILEGLKGVIGIGDDVCVYGENSEDHDRNLTKLMETAQDEGLVFNSAKCLIKQRSISFFGNTNTDSGITPDDDKVRDIQNMPTPENREDLHRFIGMMSYLSQFIPYFAEKAYSLRGLLKKDLTWMWDVDHQKSFDELEHAVSTSACLQYYNPTAPVQLEVDASMKGLGIALVQKEKTVAFGSKTLTECQSRYSNIERDMLGIVHGIQRYHTYLYGRPFNVITDHKPLVTSCAKALHAGPLRLQRILLKIQGYNFEIEYRPGDKMILADTLSRLPNPINNNDVDLDVRIGGLALEVEDPEHLTIALINFPTAKQQLLTDETLRSCPQALKEVIYNGWPDNVKELPSDLRA